MRKTAALSLSIALASVTSAQTPQKPQQEAAPEDVIRITINLVQTDLVVTDKNDQIIKDLKLEDFELYDNGKKQDIKFMEFVGVDTGKRVEGTPLGLPPGVQPEVPSTGPSAAELKRIIAFVVDDLTIPTEDMARVRDLLLDFVNNQMGDGDLIAIVRVVGGSGLLEQYTSDKQLLRRAVQSLTPKVHPFSTNNPGFTAADATPRAADSGPGTNDVGITSGLDAEAQTDDINKGFRTLMGLSTTNSVITSMKSLPGRKSVVLFSGGLPLYESSARGLVIDRGTQETLPVEEIRPIFGDVSSLINKITDNASRSGVVVHTMDVRGLQPRPGVQGFQDTPAKSGLGMTVGNQSVGGGGMDPTFGKTPDMALITGPDSVAGAQGLRTLANNTGGIASINTNNFRAGLDKILTRSQGYYLLGYSPSEKFDAKFHKISVKVRRDGAHVYARAGYYAREDQPASSAQATKEDLVLRAALSPLTKTELGISTLIQHKFLASDKAELDIHLFIDLKTLHFTQSPDGRYRDSFDVACFVFDQTGKARGGFSETVNPNLTPDEYKLALASGLSDSGHTELPPGYFQLRVVVRENETGRIGTTSRYLEVPNLSRKQLTMSSLFLFAVDPKQTGLAGVVPLRAQRQLSRKQDLRYAAIVYNPKLSSGQPQVRTQLIITQGDKVLLRDPEEPLNGPLSGIQVVKVGQVGLSKVLPGHYVLTLVTTDPLAEKKQPRTVSRSIDFTVVD
jgi:VWFA-related protein